MPYKILLVDDDRIFREEFTELFDDYEIIPASNGQEALQILDKPHEIDLVILDVFMPGMKGTQVLQQIRRTTPDMGIIILTGYSSKDVAVEALKGHADDYLEKPIDIEKTHKVIDNLLKTKVIGFDINASDVDDKVDRVKEFAQRNYNKKVTLEDAAATVCLSPKYLSRVFKERAGMSFSVFRLKFKIDKARELLTSTGYTIEQISQQMGYENPESFIRIFKKFTKKTPTDYRTESRNKTDRKKRQSKR